jgi:regulatory protein
VGPGRRRATPSERREERAAVDDPALVLGAAARFLEVRPRSVEEVRRRLVTSGYRADLVEDAITRLLDLGMLNDAEFARAWIESRDRSRPRGEHALRRELHLKGIEPGVVDSLLADRQAGGEGGAGDEAAADRLLTRHASALARAGDPRVRRQRAYALLARHGFSPDTCAAQARRFVSEESPGEE